MHVMPQNKSAFEWTRVFAAAWFVAAVYIVVSMFTAAYYMADTNDYANAVLAYEAGSSRYFWDFGHLFWVPLGWLLTSILGPVTRTFVNDNPRANVILVFMIVNWIAGLCSVLILRAILTNFTDRLWIINSVCVFFIFSQAFLNFSQTGCAYIPGLALLLGGLYVLISFADKPSSAWKAGLIAGLALTAAVCMWFLFGLGVPAVMLSPILLFGWNRNSRKLVFTTAVVAGLSLAIAYLLVVVGVLHITTVAGFKAWVADASHDTDISGVTRMVFGFARSFIYMGNDGVVFKRYLLHDPFNPVSLSDLLRLSVWKLLLFYGFLAAIGINLLLSAAGRRVLLFLCLAVGSVLVFAVFFDGGAIERYLPLYPALFIAFAVSLASEKSLRFLKYTAVVFGVAMVLSDTLAMAKPLLDRRQEVTTARVSELHGRMKPNSRVMLVSWQDDLVNFSRSFPFSPLNRSGELNIGALVTPGTTIVTDWRKTFAAETIKAWDQNGEMWISRRVTNPQPRAEWNWVEGDDRRVSWTDFYQFFSQLQLGDTAGGDDGFILVPRTPQNRQFLENQLNRTGNLAIGISRI
jgi:hypothetical protein